MRTKWILLTICCLALLLGSSCTNKKETAKPLACISLVTSSDSFALEIAKTFKDTMEAYGYRTQILFCDNSIETQQKQISNFIANRAKLIFVHCAGDGEDYCEVFQRARDSGSKVVVIARDLLECSDVQSIGDSLLKGVAKAEMAKEFIDTNFPDAPENSVQVLLLERLTKTGYIMTSAGMRLLSEKYLRSFDYKNLDFLKFESKEIVTYLDAEGKELSVDEPTGGLILDANARAVLNPVYDSRVRLSKAGNRDIQTVLEGQEAIEAYVASPGGSGLNLVLAFSGDAAIGANQKIMQYHRGGQLTSDLSKIAVFGSDDTEINRKLLLESASQESVLRGFVGYRSVAWEVQTMLKMALEGSGKQILELEVTRTSLDGQTNAIVQTNESYDFFKDFKLFSEWK